VTPAFSNHLIIRGNTIVILGYVAIGVASVPNAVVENNLIVNHQAT